MSADETLDVRCPCCRSRLAVDPGTGDVLDHQPPSRRPSDFDALVGDVLDGEQRRDDAFRSAFRKEKRRTELLGRKFDRARQREGGAGDDGAEDDR